EARRRGVLFQVCEDETLRGRTVRIGGRELCSFSSCSYLGLEFHPALVEGVIDATRRFGTQFSSSRGYLSAPPYRELEELLSELFGGHALISSSTSMGHQMVLPVIATERDAIVVDNQAHRSLQIAATLAQASGATVETVRHRELDGKALETVERLARRHRTVYFACDGVYSMYGDCAPFGLLQQVLDVAPNVRIYVDDAHGMSWAGKHGRGYFLSRMPLDERVVLGTSLVKAFAAGGGCFVFSSEEERERVRICGGPYVFSGPLQPPMMGAALASARLHLSGELEGLQRVYRERVDLCNVLLAEHGLPLLSRNDGPIFFLPLGRAEAAMSVAERMMDEGYYVTISTYPSVPTRRAGIRLTLTSLHTPGEVRGVVEALARHVPRALEEHGVTAGELDALFHDAVPRESRGFPAREADGGIGRLRIAIYRERPAAEARTALPAGWKVEVRRTVRDLDAAEWDRCMAGHGASSWAALRTAEELFRDQPRREHRWEWRYLTVRDEAGAPRAATYFVRALHKDDMFSQERVSREVERLRGDDPYLLTSEVLMQGSLLSEGNHLFLDRTGPWREALAALVEAMLEQAAEWKVSSVVLRDFAGEDPELEAWMRGRDFLKVPQLHTHQLELGGSTEAEMVAGASKRTRRFLRELVEASAPFRARVLGVHGEQADDPGLAAHLHRLYLQVASRRQRINVFTLPEGLVPALLASPAWEVVVLTLDAEAGGPEDGRPVAWYAAHRGGDDYAVFMCGVDYAYVADREYGAYRQLLLRMTRRARELGTRTLHWGMDADLEKGRFGAEAHPTSAYVLVRDHDHGEQLQEIVRSVGLTAVGQG
ncbi:MAG: GNAT family N-acetyltransferase, partial [Gemmatimonadetes bacterium]|nr:GNAT family N-acetyltransferase [Gemmatimonadota bacterium]